MTRQEEIREGMTELLKSAGLIGNKSFNQALWTADGLLHYLKSKGCVIKVDHYVSGTEVNCPSCHCAFLDKTEPLVEGFKV